ncbi:MAG TPA: ABC transporter substrate-binding protein [Spirochaetia bacterium]|nr:ABC transporter substrate-binding protein [Spirochaetia bacterium]
MTKRIAWALAITAALLLAACGGGGGGSTVKIGMIYNMTGSQASLDSPSANGAKLAAKEINAAGGVLGKKITLVAYDGKSDAATIANSATQLAQSDKVVAMLGFSDSDMVMAAAPVAAKAGVVFVTSGATSPKLPDQVPDYLYLACFGDNVQAAAGAEYAFDGLKAKTAYLLIDKGMEYTLLLGKYFKERFTELGGSIVLEDTYQGGDKDFSAQITKLKGQKKAPDLLYIAAGPDDIGTVVKQFRDAGVKKPIMGGDGYDTPLLVQVAGAGAENVYFTTHSLMDSELGTDAVKKFIAAYQAEYKNPPENAFAGLGYDTVKLIADSIKRANSADPKAIRAALQSTKDLPGVTGAITYQPGSRIPQKGVTVILVKGGKFTLAQEVVPQKVPAP